MAGAQIRAAHRRLYRRLPRCGAAAGGSRCLSRHPCDGTGVKLYLVRHPPPDVEAGICYGVTDLSLAPGAADATLAAVRERLPAGLPLFSSPLRRCSEFATQLAPAVAATRLELDVRLAEMHFGAWEMRRWNDIPRSEIDAWAANPCEFQPPDGESVLAMTQRVRAFLNDRRARNESAVVVCHAGSIRLLLACMQNASDRDAAIAVTRERLAIPYGSLTVLG
ncbi:phosphoglycerate mutase [Oxalobacteraceae bacterium OM1]|nr:phosphoglycerate mutase [Oxalobacteraceae bacterium OM1]